MWVGWFYCLYGAVVELHREDLVGLGGESCSSSRERQLRSTSLANAKNKGRRRRLEMNWHGKWMLPDRERDVLHFSRVFFERFSQEIWGWHRKIRNKLDILECLVERDQTVTIFVLPLGSTNLTISSFMGRASEHRSRNRGETKGHYSVTVFWYTAPCSLVEIEHRFKGAYSFHYHMNGTAKKVTGRGAAWMARFIAATLSRSITTRNQKQMSAHRPLIRTLFSHVLSAVGRKCTTDSWYPLFPACYKPAVTPSLHDDVEGFNRSAFPPHG
jgi:hypothetical protein